MWSPVTKTYIFLCFSTSLTNMLPLSSVKHSISRVLNNLLTTACLALCSHPPPPDSWTRWVIVTWLSRLFIFICKWRIAPREPNDYGNKTKIAQPFVKQLVSASSKQKSAGACSAWVPWAAWLVGYSAGEEEPLLGSPASTNLGMKVRGIFWAESWDIKQ